MFATKMAIRTTLKAASAMRNIRVCFLVILIELYSFGRWVDFTEFNGQVGTAIGSILADIIQPSITKGFGG